MAVQRQGNWLGQMRVDVPHLRGIEAAVAADFQALAGRVLAGSKPLIVSGMTISMTGAVGSLPSNLLLNVAGSVLLHATATEPGSVFSVDVAAAPERLSSTNSKVVGAFVQGVNYIGIDLVRATDAATSDSVVFRSASTENEFTRTVPLARVLNYRIHVQQTPFDETLNVAPVARVVVGATGYVESVTDCRNLMYRLGSGGTNPNALRPFTFSSRRETSVTSTDSTDPFVGGDKNILSGKDFYDALMTRMWEIGGGEHWYSATTDRDLKLVYSPDDLFVTGENFSWDGTDLLWRGLSLVFGNSAAHTNAIQNRTAAAAGITNLADGECLYVDTDRSQAATLVPAKASLTALGMPTIPGSRLILAWRSGARIYTRDTQKAVGADIPRVNGTVTAGPGWELVGTPILQRSGNVVTLSMSARVVSLGTAAWTNIATLPVGFRPIDMLPGLFARVDVLGGSYTFPASAVIYAAGQISCASGWIHTAPIPLPPEASEVQLEPNVGCVVDDEFRLTVTYIAA